MSKKELKEMLKTLIEIDKKALKETLATLGAVGAVFCLFYCLLYDKPVYIFVIIPIGVILGYKFINKNE